MKKILSFFAFTIMLISQSLVVDSRIMGGEIIQDSDTSKPWLVNFNNSCTASVFDKKFILTAFHCINSFSIKEVKETYILKIRGTAQERTIKNVYLPYANHDTNGIADIVVIELTEDVIIDSYIKIPSEDFLDSYYGKQDVALLLGYGENDISATPFSQSTQLKLSIMDRASCDTLMLKEDRRKIEDNFNYFVCDDAKADVQRKGKDIGMCAGDSGGPLAIQKDGEFYQIGTVSGYSDDGNSPYCGKNSAFYGSVVYHSKWINNVLAGKVKPVNNYEIDGKSEESYFYSVMEYEITKGTWTMLGTSSELNFDVSRMPSKFLLYTYKNKKFTKYTEASGSIQILDYKGFWFYKK